MEAGPADDIPESTPVTVLTDIEENDVSSPSTPAILDPLPDEITVPRIRPFMQKIVANATASSSQQAPPSSSPTKQSSRRSLSKGRRKSVDGRPLKRSMKMTVRMKPRTTPATLAANGLNTVAGPATSKLSPSPSYTAGSSPSPRKASSSSARRASSPSPRKPSGGRPTQICNDELAKNDRLGSLKASCGLRPRYSVSYRLGKRPRPVAGDGANVDTSSSSSATGSPTPTPATTQSVEPTPTSNVATESENPASESAPRAQEEPPPQPAPQVSEAEKLAEAWREVRQRERQLKEGEAALRLGQKRLRQDREALEKEKRQLYEEQQHQRRATREEESRKRRTARRSRSRSKPRNRLVPDDSWRHDERHRGSSDKDNQQDNGRHPSWSSVNTSTSPSSPCPSDTESATTATTHTTSSTSSHNQSQPKADPTTSPCEWTSSTPHLAASYARYSTEWNQLPPRSAHIPYPSPNHTSRELHQTSHLPLSIQERWSPDAVVKYNALFFFLAARGVPVAPDIAAAQAKVGFGGVAEGGDGGLKALVKEVRRELKRWHEDGLKYRSGGGEGDDGEEGKVNEELVRDETARAVFRAFTELRDGLIAEMRWRRESGIAPTAAPSAAATEAGAGREEKEGTYTEEEERSGGGRQTDWTVLSEAIL